MTQFTSCLITSPYLLFVDLNCVKVTSHHPQHHVINAHCKERRSAPALWTQMCSERVERRQDLYTFVSMWFGTHT